MAESYGHSSDLRDALWSVLERRTQRLYGLKLWQQKMEVCFVFWAGSLRTCIQVLLEKNGRFYVSRALVVQDINGMIL